jgi:hypothetical protein
LACRRGRIGGIGETESATKAACAAWSITGSTQVSPITNSGITTNIDAMARTPSFGLRSNRTVSAGRERRPTEITVSIMPTMRTNLTASAASKRVTPCAWAHRL